MDELDRIIDTLGRERSSKILLEHVKLQAAGDVLTIVTNKGGHFLPDSFLRGEIFYASEGNLDFSSLAVVKQQYEEILHRLSLLLKSKRWSRIFIVPFGPSTLSMQIKLLVYRITSLDSVDIFYDGHGNHYDLEITQRTIITKSAE